MTRNPPKLAASLFCVFRNSYSSLAMACVNSSHGPRDQWPLAREFATTGNKVREGSAVQIASASVSLVRIRTTWSRPYTKILPSPIFPVFADEVIVLMISST